MIDTTGLTDEQILRLRYKYLPSLAAAALFCGLFFLSTGYHAFQLIRRRTWYFIPFLVGGIIESIGYLTRVIDSQVAERNLFIVQAVFILVAPAVYVASIYMILKRIIKSIRAESYALIRVRWLTAFFVGGDVLSFVVQGLGGSLLASADGDRGQANLGKNLIIVGLFIQLVVFGLFIVTTAVFHIRIQKKPTAEATSSRVPWLRYLVVLYAADVLIMIRSIFRVVEYMQGAEGYLLGHEVFFYCLDSALMFVLSVLFNIWHPSTIVSPKIQAEKEVTASRAGV